MALRRMLSILLVSVLTSGAAVSQGGDPIVEQYRAGDIEGLLKPALQKDQALALEGRVRESNQEVLDGIPEAKRQPVHDFALAKLLYRNRNDISAAFLEH